MPETDENLVALAKVWLRTQSEQQRRQQYFSGGAGGATPTGNPFE